MAEDLIREIHTQFDLITNDLAALPQEDRIAWFRRTTYVQPLHFLKEINGTTYAVRAFFDAEAKENGFKNTRVFIDDRARPLQDRRSQKSWNWQKRALSAP